MSDPAVQNEYKQVHRTFIQWKEDDLTERGKLLFTGQHIVNFIENNLLEDNETLIEKIDMKLKKIVRYYGESPVDWFDRFQPLISKLRKATDGGLTEKQEEKGWKLTFARNISSHERSIIQQRADEFIAGDDYTFTTESWDKVKYYYQGTFLPTELRNLLVLIEAVQPLKNWKPDKANQDFNNKRYALFDEDPCYDNPKLDGRTSNKRGARQGKNLLAEDDDDSEEEYTHGNFAVVSPGTSKRAKIEVPPHIRCDNPMCVQRGNHTNHARASYQGNDYPKCHFRSQHLGGDSQQKAIKNDFQRGKPKCWNCGSTERLIRDCPKMKDVKGRLRNNRQFMTTCRTLFTTQAEKETMNRIVDCANLNKDICFKCLKVSDNADGTTGCNGNCTDSPTLLREIKEARTKFFAHPQLMLSIKQAGTETSNAAGPMTAQAFLAYDGGQGASTVSEEPNSLFFETVNTQEHLSRTEPTDKAEDERIDEDEGSPGNQMFLSEAPMAPIGLEVQSRLYGDLHKEEGGKPKWKQSLKSLLSPHILKANTKLTGRVAKGKAHFLMPNDQGAKVKKSREMYLDSCGSYPLIQREELHDVKDCSEYGMPPLRFSTLESKTSWYNEVGLAIMLQKDGTSIRIPAYAYSTKRGTDLHDDASFYLIDMSTLLDIGVDIQYHMQSSRNGEVRDIKFLEDRPDRFKVAGTRRSVLRGSRFSAALQRTMEAKKRAKSHLTSWGQKVKRIKQDIGRENKKHELFLQKCDEDIRAGDSCSCQIRVADSLSAEDYLRIQDDLQSLAIGSIPPTVLLGSSAENSALMESN